MKCSTKIKSIRLKHNEDDTPCDPPTSEKRTEEGSGGESGTERGARGAAGEVQNVTKLTLPCLPESTQLERYIRKSNGLL